MWDLVVAPDKLLQVDFWRMFSGLGGRMALNWIGTLRFDIATTDHDDTPSFNSNYRHLQWCMLLCCILLNIIYSGAWDPNMLGLELGHR